MAPSTTAGGLGEGGKRALARRGDRLLAPIPISFLRITMTTSPSLPSHVEYIPEITAFLNTRSRSGMETWANQISRFLLKCSGAKLNC
jgi:hypothetical protein